MTLDRKDYKTAIPQLEKRISAVEGDATKGLANFDVLASALEAERIARQKAVLKVDEGIDLVTVKMFYALVDPNDYVGGLPPESTSWSETMPELDPASVIVAGSNPERKRVLWYKSKTLRNGVVVNETVPQQIQLMDGVFSFVNTVSSNSGWTTIDGGSITTGKIKASQGDSFLNLDDGTFKVYSSVTGQGIIWNGSDLTINGSITLTGHSDTVAQEISALQISADGTLIYDHEYSWSGNTSVTFTAHVYRGGVDVTSEFADKDFTWYYKTESDLAEHDLLNNQSNTPKNCGKTITISSSTSIKLSDMGYGGEIIGKFTPPSNSRNLLRSNGDTYTDVNNRSLQTRAGSGDEVRVRDLEYTTSLTTSNALMVVTSETEKLATIETLADTLKSTTTPLVDGTATAGTEKKFASGNHVHPTDTSRASAVHTHTTSDVTDFPSLATVATSGDYDDLTDKPTIPTDTSDLTNGAGYITGISVVQTLATGVEIGSVEGTKLYAPQGGGGGTSDYSALSNKPSINTVTLSGDKSSSDLSLADASHTHTTSDVTDFPSLATVATSGDYDDLDNLPTIPTVTDTYSGSSSNGMSGKAVKSAIDALDGTISGTAGAGKTLTAFSQTDGKVSATFANISITKSQVSDFPTIPTVNNATLTIQKNGTTVNTFTANASSNVTANISVPTSASDVGALPTSGGTLTGQLLTSFKTSVAMGSYGSSQTTVPNLVEEVRFSSGCCGSVSIGTAYTANNETIATGWYNFMYMPHRSGGVNGSASGDNCNYGNLFLFGMNNTNGRFIVRVSSGSIAEVAKIYTSIERYTRSSAGTLDWSNQTDGDAKVIMKSALAFWNGAYSGSSSNLKYSVNGEILGKSTVKDYVVEQGTNYRKWNSGLAECWGTATNGSGGYVAVTFPLTFKATPMCVASAHYLSGGTYVAPTVSVAPSTTGATFYLRVSTSTVTQGHTVSYEAKGKWK